MRKDVLNKVIRYYKERLAFYDSLKAEAIAKAHADEDIAKMADRIKEIKCMALRGKLTPAIDREYDELTKRYDKAIASYLPNIKYECDACKDTGVHDNKYCTCFKSHYLDELKNMSNLDGLPTETFTTSNLDSFKLDDEIKAKYKTLYDELETFANNYPNVEKKNIYLMGNPGSGKSFLVSCIANALVAKGVTVQYITAFDLSELMLKCHLDYKNDSMSIITNADVLIIDDLGSEPMRNNINKTYLQSILDSRIAHDKSTIVTTNLKPEEFMNKYGERITSRLFNFNTCIKKDLFSLPNLRFYKK